MKAIIHIGMHKTGTSSIQASFHSKPPKGCDYLRHAGTNLNGWARLMFEGQAEIAQLATYAGKSQDELGALRDKTDQNSVAALQKMSEDTVILSAERFTYMNDEAVASFRKWVDSQFDDYAVYAYVRDPMPFVRSSFQQRAKSLAVLKNFLPDMPNYQSRFEKFETSFGTDKLHYRMFRPNQLENRNVVEDFAKWIGTDYTDADTIKENEGISLEALAFLVTITLADERTKLPQRKLNQLVTALQKHKGSRWRLSDNRVAEINKQISADIDWMDARLPEKLDRGDTSDNTAIDTPEDFSPLGLEHFETFRDLVFSEMPPATRNLREISSSLRILKHL